MIRVTVILLLVVSAASAIPGISVPPGMNSVPYDVLISNRLSSAPPNANEVHFGAGYYLLGMNNEYYDSEGEVLERFSGDGGFTSMWVPIFADIYLKDIARIGVVTDLRYWVSSFSGSSINDFVLSDICVFGERMFAAGAGWYFGPRVGFIYAVDDFLSTGYNDLDITAIIGKGAEKDKFVIDTAIGGRYSFEYSGNAEDSTGSYKPGSLLYVNIRPGLAYTKAFSFYGIFNYAYMFESKHTDGSTVTDSDAYALYAGVSPVISFGDYHSTGLVFKFPIAGKNADKEILIGVNYDAYIPF